MGTTLNPESPITREEFEKMATELLAQNTATKQSQHETIVRQTEFRLVLGAAVIILGAIGAVFGLLYTSSENTNDSLSDLVKQSGYLQGLVEMQSNRQPDILNEINRREELTLKQISALDSKVEGIKSSVEDVQSKVDSVDRRISRIEGMRSER